MNLTDQVTLSFYRELTPLRADSAIMLVQHVEDRKIYVKKKLSVYDQQLYMALQELEIPGIPRIHHVIADNDALIVIEDYINEENLKSVLNRKKSFSLSDAANILVQLCNILQQLHQATPPIIHRDIKPSNILLSPDNKVWLIDFNASKTYDKSKTQDTLLMGTAAYAAPEQFGFSQSDARTDIYALGVLFNELLTGCLPKDRLHDGAGSKIIEKCLQMDPDERYPSIEHLSDAFAEFLPTPSVKSVLRKLSRYLPPGFRSKTPWKMVTGVLGYSFTIWFAVISEFTDAPSPLIENIDRIGVFLIEMLLIAFYGNYLGVAQKLPFTSYPHILVKIFGYAFWTFLCLALSFMFMDVAEAIIPS